MKKGWILLLVVFIAFSLACCSAADVEMEAAESGSEEMELDTVSAEGRLVGAIDGNSVEIEIDGLPSAFRTEELLRDGEKLTVEDGSDVSIVYYVDQDGRQMLLEIYGE